MNSNIELREDIKHLIIIYLQGNCTKDELDKFNRWLHADERNRDYFNSIKLTWVLADKVVSESRFDDKRLWKSLQSKMKHPKTKSFKFNSGKINFSQIVRIAASWLVVFILGYSISYWIVKKNLQHSSQLTTISSPLGSRTNVTLPDGTSVWLNAGSSLEYFSDFNTSSREVKLSGEAFFDVSSNVSKPFIVNAQNIFIKAYGTTFNVKAYSEEKKVITTLVEGIVKIEGKDELQRPFIIAMEPRQKVTCFVNSDKSGRPANLQNTAKSEGVNESKNMPANSASKDFNVKTELFTSWKDSRWIVQGEKFKDLALMLGRRYNVSIIISSGELNNFRFSGIIENETPEQVFEILRLTMPIEYSIDKGEIKVRIDNKLKEKYKAAY